MRIIIFFPVRLLSTTRYFAAEVKGKNKNGLEVLLFGLIPQTSHEDSDEAFSPAYIHIFRVVVILGEEVFSLTSSPVRVPV